MPAGRPADGDVSGSCDDSVVARSTPRMLEPWPTDRRPDAQEPGVTPRAPDQIWSSAGRPVRQASLTFFISRLFWRAAAFLWITPFCAAESMRLTCCADSCVVVEIVLGVLDSRLQFAAYGLVALVCLRIGEVALLLALDVGHWGSSGRRRGSAFRVARSCIEQRIEAIGGREPIPTAASRRRVSSRSSREQR